MPNIAITQRVEAIKTGERRDGLDQRWAFLIRELGAEILPVPNTLFHVDEDKKLSAWLSEHKVSGVILSGGNTPICPALGPLDDAAPERDILESLLLTVAPQTGIPLVGVCRGMQMINCFYGGSLAPLDGHVAVRHRIEKSLKHEWAFPESVNSYHNYGISPLLLAPALETLAFSEDGGIEAFKHKEHRIYGIMWHPERERPFSYNDTAILKEWLLPNTQK